MTERLMEPVCCTSTHQGHLCAGQNGECVRRGHHRCAHAFPTCPVTWPYQPPVEVWADARGAA